MGVIYAVAWSLMLLMMLGPMGLVIGWPATIGISALMGAVMEATDVTPRDVTGFMIHALLLIGVIMGGVFAFL